MENKVLNCINPDGSLSRVVISIEERKIVASSTLQQELLRGYHRSFEVRPGLVAVLTSGETYIYESIPSLVINAPWTPHVHDGKTFIKFSPGGGDNFSLSWTPPRGVEMVFCTTITAGGHRAFYPQYEGCYIFLVSREDRQAFKPPFSNLYDDCKICMGRQGDPTPHKTAIAAHERALTLANSSAFNADLRGGAEQSWLVQYEVTKSGPVQVRQDPTGPGTNWRNGLVAVSTNITKQYIDCSYGNQ